MTPINLHDFEHLAESRLPKPIYDYFASGAGDEITARDNLSAWGRWRLRPRVLVDVSACDTATTVLGQPMAAPVLTAPCALNALAHPDGELAVARAAAALGLTQVVSTFSAYSLEEIAAAAPAGRRWFQLYCFKDRGLTAALVRRAEAAGYGAVCVTVDTPQAGLRERDMRNRFQLPVGVAPKALAQAQADTFRDAHRADAAPHQNLAHLLDSSLTWDLIGWLRSLTRLPILLKGVMCAEDARLAVQYGVDGVIVSNHGGRQLDGALATADVLPEIVETVQGRLEVLVDGGLRRGSDVLKAVALGARAVLIGRPYVWALAVDGEAGVQTALSILLNELRLSMALAGCASLADLTRDRVVRHG